MTPKEAGTKGGFAAAAINRKHRWGGWSDDLPAACEHGCGWTRQLTTIANQRRALFSHADGRSFNLSINVPIHRLGIACEERLAAAERARG